MKYFAGFVLGIMLLPSVASAATLTQVQVSAILSVLQAFGVDSATLLSVEQALAPAAPETSITASNTIVTTQSAPILGSATTTTCVDSPVFNFVPSVYGNDGKIPQNGSPLQVPYGATAYLDGTVNSSCTGEILPYPSGFDVIGRNMGMGKVGSNYQTGYYNNGYRFSTTTVNLVITAMGKYSTTTLELLPD